MELKLYFHMLRRSWWIIAVTALTAIGAALIVSYFTTPVYQASARFIVSPNPAYLSGESNVIYSLDTLDKGTVITTYAEILNGPRIYNETVAALKLSPTEISDFSYNAIVLPDTNIIEFSGQGTNPALVASLTNGMGSRAVQYIESLYPVYDITLLDAAQVPTTPISPQPLRDAAVAFAVGLALGTALALIRELLRAPIMHFVQQHQLDSISLALSRPTFEDKLEKVAFASAQDFCLCILHLGGLAEYIDVLPQPALENIFRHVTQMLKDQLRGNDLVGRWNDLEFAILLSATPGQAAWNTMERVRNALSAPFKLEITGENVSLDPKIGIAEYRVGDTAKSLVSNTNWALEVATKTTGMYLLRATEPI